MCADRWPADPAGGSDPASKDSADSENSEDSGEPDRLEAARQALARARSAARDRGAVPGAAGVRRRRRPAAHHPDVVPGAGRDPEAVGDSMERLSAQLGWRAPLSIGGVIGRWREVVGDQVADHAQPETFIEGKLVVRADSTAWTTQLRLLLPQLERRLAEEIGEGVVTEIHILGPGGPSWRRGPRSVPGRGPRDTYG